jgi:hypothetical protein
MSRHFFRAMRDFGFVRLPHYLRVFAIFLIFVSPVLVTVYFYAALEHFNDVTYAVPSFALLALSAIIFYGLGKYLDYDRMTRDPWGELYWQEELPRHASILAGIATVLLIIGIILFPGPL